MYNSDVIVYITNSMNFYLLRQMQLLISYWWEKQIRLIFLSFSLEFKVSAICFPIIVHIIVYKTGVIIYMFYL